MEKQGNTLGLSLSWRLVLTYPGLREEIGLCGTVRKRSSNGDLCHSVERIAHPIVACRPQSAARRNFLCMMIK